MCFKSSGLAIKAGVLAVLNLKAALSLLPCGQNFTLRKAAVRAQDDFLWWINVFLSLEYSFQSRLINEDFSYLNTWKVVRMVSFLPDLPPGRKVSPVQGAGRKIRNKFWLGSVYEKQQSDRSDKTCETCRVQERLIPSG